MIGYTVTVTDTGQTPYTGATFTDSLAGALDDASYDGDAAATAGSVTYSSPNLTWTGNLAVGATADDHVLGDGEQPRHRRQGDCDRRHLEHGGQHLPAGRQQPRLHRHGGRAHPGPDHRDDRPAPGTTTPGSVVNYTVTVTNSGQTPYTGASVHRPAGRGAG